MLPLLLRTVQCDWKCDRKRSIRLINPKIIKKEGKTAILVTHDISEAISMSDRIIILTHRPAKVKNIYDLRITIYDFKFEDLRN